MKIGLLDYENVQTLEPYVRLQLDKMYVFCGKNQHKFSILDLPTEVELNIAFLRIEHTAKNNVDFHIACKLGELLNKEDEFIIISKDKGYAGIIEYNKNRGYNVRRYGYTVTG